MFGPGDVLIQIDDLADHPVWVVTATTPAGTVRILCLLEVRGRKLVARDAHIEGLSPGAIGRAGLNAIGWKLMEIADVDDLIVQGAIRTTGARRGRRPAAFRLRRPRGPKADSAGS